MNFAAHHLLTLAACSLLAATAVAQSPVRPPPWWNVQDEVTVSLYWNFDGPAPLVPTAATVPTWYSPLVTQMVLSPNVVVINTPTGTGLGLIGNGAPQNGAIELTVDNDPYPDYIKLFWFQFDALQGASGNVAALIEESLNYKRAIISQKSQPLGGGWERITIDAQLIPQPDDEGIDWTFLENALGTVGIDNLFVNSKCIKPKPDETGDALGDVGARQNLSLLPAGLAFTSAAVTEGPPPLFQKTYWVTARATALGAHSLLRLTGTLPTLVVASSTVLGGTLTTSPQGPGDIAVETVTVAGAVTQQIVWTILDERPAGLVRLVGVDASGGNTSILILNGFPNTAIVPAGQQLGLAFDPSGEFGNGTFWVASTNGAIGTMREFSRQALTSGALIDTRQIEPDCVGLGYDAALGSFYGFSSAPQPTPTGPIEVNGFVVSGYDFAATGVRFCGDLNVPNRGGVALAMETYRSRSAPTAQLNLVCLVNTNANQQVLYEMAGPFGFGWSVLGRCGMRDTGPFNGLPFVGSTMEVTLTGVPNSLFAMMFLGFSNTTSTIGALPIALSPLLGWPESILSISPDVNSGLMAPSAVGEFSLPITIPPVAALAYSSVYFQWLALDTTITGGFAMSQAGKTVIYP